MQLVHLEVFKFFDKYLCNYLEFSFSYSLFIIYINNKNTWIQLLRFSPKHPAVCSILLSSQ